VKLREERAGLEVQINRELPLKDQPIDTDELNRIWEEVEYCWRTVEYLEYNDPDNTNLLRELYGRLKVIKHRFFNQIVC